MQQISYRRMDNLDVYWKFHGLSRNLSKMTNLYKFFLFPTRLFLWLLSLLYWGLVYGTACITVLLLFIRFTWKAFRNPQRLFQWTVRQEPPACLRDVRLGKHGFLWGRVRQAFTLLSLCTLPGKIQMKPTFSHLWIMVDYVKQLRFKGEFAWMEFKFFWKWKWDKKLIAYI